MPITTSQMIANEATISFPWLGETVNVTYYPGKLSDNMIVQLDQDVDMMNKALVQLIKSWDVLEPDGSMFPLDATRFAELDVTFKWRAGRAMIQQMRPNLEASLATAG